MQGPAAVRSGAIGGHADTVLPDVLMPGMDGYDVIAHLLVDPATRETLTAGPQ